MCVYLGFDADPSLDIAARIRGPNVGVYLVSSLLCVCNLTYSPYIFPFHLCMAFVLKIMIILHSAKSIKINFCLK